MDPLRWFADFALEKHRHSSDAEKPAAARADLDLVRRWNVRPIEFGRRFVDANSGPNDVSWADSRFYTGSRRAGDALVPSLRRHVARKLKVFNETEPAQRRFRGRVWWNAGGAGSDGAGAGGKVQAGCGWCRTWQFRGEGKNDGGGGNNDALLAGSSGVAAAVAWILLVLVWRCRARLPNVLVSFMKCLMIFLVCWMQALSS